MGRDGWNWRTFGGNEETYCNRNSMDSMTVRLVKTPSNGEYRVSADQLLYPGKVSSGRTGFHSIEFWAKVVKGNPQTAHTVV